MTIYVVLGERDGFDGHESLMVKGFFDDISARKYAQKCVIAAVGYKSKLELLNCKYRELANNRSGFFEEKTEFETINEYDPWFDPKCGKHEYRVEPLEVEKYS